MPTKKQRRRRQKFKRHEYEDVYVDEHGREVEVDDDEAEPEPARTVAARPKKGAQPRRTGRVIQPPSWRRVGRRTLIFAPLMFVMVMLLEPDIERVAQVTLTLWMVLLFAPFTYVMDMVTYRMWRRREERAAGGRAR